MSATDTARNETLAKLAQSREEIRRLLEPPPRQVHQSGPNEQRVDAAHGGSFPRSRTMKLLLSGRGLGTAGAVVGGLLMARPALAFRLVRMLPTGALGRMLLVKAITTFRSKNSPD